MSCIVLRVLRRIDYFQGPGVQLNRPACILLGHWGCALCFRGALEVVNPPQNTQDDAGHSTRDRALAKLRACGGMYVGSLREFSLVLGGSKSATGAALAGLERDGLIVRVAASHGKGSAIRLTV